MNSFYLYSYEDYQNFSIETITVEVSSLKKRLNFHLNFVIYLINQLFKNKNFNY